MDCNLVRNINQWIGQGQTEYEIVKKLLGYLYPPQAVVHYMQQAGFTTVLGRDEKGQYIQVGSFPEGSESSKNQIVRII